MRSEFEKGQEQAQQLSGHPHTFHPRFSKNVLSLTRVVVFPAHGPKATTKKRFVVYATVTCCTSRTYLPSAQPCTQIYPTWGRRLLPCTSVAWSRTIQPPSDRVNHAYCLIPKGRRLSGRASTVGARLMTSLQHRPCIHTCLHKSLGEKL